MKEVLDLEYEVFEEYGLGEELDECQRDSWVCIDEMFRLVGYVVISREDDEDEYNCFHVVSLCVRSRFRRIGVGTTLIQNAINFLHPSRPILNAIYYVPDDNYLTGFYERCGFNVRMTAMESDGSIIHTMEYVLPKESSIVRVNGRAMCRKTGEYVLVPERYYQHDS